MTGELKGSLSSISLSKEETRIEKKDDTRLIERAFPLKQASLDSIHEKNVRHGHISTMHIWPARRPLAACRATIVATLLNDPGSPDSRKEILERLGGKVEQVTRKKRLSSGQVKVEHKEETVGGILHWGRESSPDLKWFRQKIRDVYGGRAPRILDPFAGGGAIPLEAMRLGCEVVAGDINPVAWLILKCTLEYPQKLAVRRWPLPRFALDSPEFMQEYWKDRGMNTKENIDARLHRDQTALAEKHDVGLAWHVRAWGCWVLQRAKQDLDQYYRAVEGKPTIAYLWARTVTCNNCRARVPLIKTRWLCKKSKRRVLMVIEPKEDRSGVGFGVQENVPITGDNAAQRSANDKKLGKGTVSGSGATCPCCGKGLSRDNIRWEASRTGFGTIATAVVVRGPFGKEYLPPTEVQQDDAAINVDLSRLAKDLPFGLPTEKISNDTKGSAWCVDYGIRTWDHIFTNRQMLTLGSLSKHTRSAKAQMEHLGYPPDWKEAITAYLGLAIGRMADFQSTGVIWSPGGEFLCHTFTRFALPVMWDYCEGNPLTKNVSGNYEGAIDWIARAVSHLTEAAQDSLPQVRCQSAIEPSAEGYFDTIITDPPYYDAISYANIMDFFYVWHRRTLHGLTSDFDQTFAGEVAPKWAEARNDGELVDDATRFGGDKQRSRIAYEDGMFRAFQACRKALRAEGRLVVVFANKHPEAWEALLSAIIRAGYVVVGSWPIQTERVVRMRSLTSAALSSSIWLICRKRPDSARPGWDNQVLLEMRARIHERLLDFWDAGIRGPDFVWAATGPALEAYSKHPVVKKANEPGTLMVVSEFLRQVRRMVVDFVVGRVLSKNGDGANTSGLDDVTTYYLLHRHDFGFRDVPAGACILYAVSCGLSDSALANEYDLIAHTGRIFNGEDDEEEEASNAEQSEAEPEEGYGSVVRLKTWDHRRGSALGYEKNGRPAPMIDRIHRLMHLWRDGDIVLVDSYLYEQNLPRNSAFHQVLQALVELSQAGSEERSLLESISNHIAAKGGHVRGPKSISEYGSPNPEEKGASHE